MLLTDDEVELVEVEVDREVPEMDIVPNESHIGMVGRFVDLLYAIC